MKQPQATIIWFGLIFAALEVFYGGLMLIGKGKWAWFHDAAIQWLAANTPLG